MVSRVMLASSSYTFWVMVSSDAAGMKHSMNKVATAPSAKAIGMPENSATMVVPP